jgi:hypothetical protein
MNHPSSSTRLCPILLVALLSGLFSCQTAPAGGERTEAEQTRERLTASEGGQVVLRAIEAHGGLEAWYAAPTSAYTWEYANVGADLHFKSYMVADNRTRQVYHDLLTVGPYGDPQPVDARFAWDGTDAWMWPASIESPNARFWATTGYYFQQIPFVLADPGLRYERLPDEELDGTTYQMVIVSYDDGVGDSPGDTYTLYVHPETGLVDAIRYTVTFGRGRQPGTPQRETLMYYRDYVTVDRLTVPRYLRGYAFADGRRGEFRNEAWADSISFKRAFDVARLRAPHGARVDPPPGQ